LAENGNFVEDASVRFLDELYELKTELRRGSVFQAANRLPFS